MGAATKDANQLERLNAMDSTDREALRKSLRELHDQLLKLDDVKPQTEQLLRTLATDIDQVLDDASPHKGDENLATRWRDALLEFEGRHPMLAQMMDQVTTALANLGV
jgi:ABC-type transporter Mla subunit MlaD